MIQWYHRNLSSEDFPRLPIFKQRPWQHAVLARELSGPAGMGLHPQTGVLFVAEPSRNQLQMFRTASSGWRDGQRCYLGTLSCVETGLPWGPGERRIRRPERLVFDSAGRLFVMESCRGGRILCFDACCGIPINAETVAWASPDHSRRFTGLSLDDQERPVVASFAVEDMDPALKVEVFEQREPGEWEVAGEDFRLISLYGWPRNGHHFGLAPGADHDLQGCAGVESEDWAREVATFFYRLGSYGPVGGVAADLNHGLVYLSLREEGIVLCLSQEKVPDRTVAGLV